MADQLFPVTSGFYDAIDGDRVYSADDMCRPYRRLVSNGVFATQEGNPSTDFQVLANNSLVLTVKAGEGVFGNKWFESPSDLSITVPSNTGIVPRIDSVIVQVDRTQAGRVGNVVYRTGTPASTPSAPAINEVTAIDEYRVANIYVGAGVSSLTQSNITDTRGTAECPWITSLVRQVDTSVLFSQWEDAFERFYAQATADYDAYKTTQETNWEAFIDSLTDDLTAEMNLIPLSSSYTTTASTSSIPIGIASFNKDSDVLMVFVNGLRLSSDRFTVTSNSTVTLQNAVSAGQTVSFLALHAVIGGDLQTVEAMIQALDAKVAALEADSGWVYPSLKTGFSSVSGSSFSIRKIGKIVYVRGAVTSAGGTTSVTTLPVGYRPANKTMIPTVSYGANVAANLITLNTNGSLTIKNGLNGTSLPTCFSFSLG